MNLFLINSLLLDILIRDNFMNKENLYLNHFFLDKNNKSNTFWDKDFRKLI